jgi:hypothetical protein
MTETKLRKLIQVRVAGYRTQREASLDLDISEQYLSEILRDKPISESVARRFGYTAKEREFEKIAKK